MRPLAIALGTIALGASLGLAGCGSTGRATSTGPSTAGVSHRILETKRIELAIAHSALAQRGVHAQVSCPSGVRQAQGLVFSCTALVGRTSTRFTVTELDGSGHVHYVAH